MDADEILDGLALWDELKPQTGRDWIAIARRSVAATDYDPSVGSILFQGLYATVKALEEVRRELRQVSTNCPPQVTRALEACDRVLSAGREPMADSGWIPCGRCRQTGLVGEHLCHRCNGSGWVQSGWADASPRLQHPDSNEETR